MFAKLAELYGPEPSAATEQPNEVGSIQATNTVDAPAPAVETNNAPGMVYTSVSRFTLPSEELPPPVPPKNKTTNASNLSEPDTAAAPPMMSQVDSFSPEKPNKKLQRHSTFFPKRFHIAETVPSPRDNNPNRVPKASAYDIQFGGDSQSEMSSNAQESKLEEVTGWLSKLPVSKTFVDLDKVG